MNCKPQKKKRKADTFAFEGAQENNENAEEISGSPQCLVKLVQSKRQGWKTKLVVCFYFCSIHPKQKRQKTNKRIFIANPACGLAF